MNKNKNITYEDYSGGHVFFEQELEVVDYNRVSTKKEAQYFSLGDQVIANKNFIASHIKWRHVDSYIEMRSGRSISKRKAFQELLQDAQCNKFNLIVVRDTSRFARNLRDTINTIDELNQIGVAVYFIFEDIYSFNPNDYDRLVLMSLNAQKESDRKQQYTLMSLRFKKGNEIPILSSKTSGYQYISRGKSKPATYKYNESSYIVAEIFYLLKGARLERPSELDTLPNVDEEWLNTIYAHEYEPPDIRKSYSYNEICSNFNKKGIITPNNATHWHTSTISSIAHKIVYTGYFMYNLWEYDEKRERYVFRTDTDIGISVKTDSSGNDYIEDINGVLHKGDWSPIITIKDWLEIQAIIRSRRLFRDNQHPSKGKGKKSSKDIYVRRMQCINCGSRFHRQQSRSNNPNLRKKVYLYQCNRCRGYSKSDSAVQCDTKSFERIKIDYATMKVFQYFFTELKESAENAYKLMIDSYCEQGLLLIERESETIKRELDGVVRTIKSMEDDLKKQKIDYNIFKDLYTELKNDEANLNYKYKLLRENENNEIPNKVDILNKVDIALQRELVIDEDTQEVAEDFISAFLLKILTKVTDNAFELTYFLDLTGEAHIKEGTKFVNGTESHDLPKDYTVFSSFIITKPEADEYAKKLNKRCFKSHVWNDIKVNIVLGYEL